MTYADKENFIKKYIIDENTGISYILVGDVYIPNLVSTDTNYKIVYWGRKHKEYIKQYKPAFYTTLLTQCELNSYLHDVDVRATEMYDTLVKQLAKQEGVTEKLKATDMLAWVQAMNNISNRAREIVDNEFVIENYNNLYKKKNR
ncbi:TnpV protein [uncultured Eubacterium sp.]|uniref:TnpV protein n=1 Tax=uncultured Eubacterium sp. TaxID=165185 RepID=UPI0025ED2EA6|nr:TnpV protein [uncultured Eubacterium sp.]